MATNRCLRRLLLVIVLLPGFAPFLAAQNAGYYTDTKSSDLRFWQRLVWAGGEHALRYEVILEKEVDGTYRTHLREFTELPFFEVSLPPGKYRYKVISYNILDRPEEESQWEYTEVRPAVRPELSHISREYVPADSDGRPSGFVLNISGHNLVPGAEIILRQSDGVEIFPEALDSGEDDEIKVFINSDHLSDHLISGKYKIVIRNPGSLEAVMDGITLSAPKPEPKEIIHELLNLLVFFGPVWAPVGPLHGDFFGKSFSPAGVGLRLGVVYPIPRGIYIGLEGTVFLHSYDAKLNDYSWGLNLLAMKWLPNQITALSFRLGSSYILYQKDILHPKTPEKFMYNIGVSSLWRFTERVLLEAGFEYAIRIKENSFHGCIRPCIGVIIKS